MARGQQQQDNTDEKELASYLKDVKDMNLAKLKTSLDNHINMGYHFKQTQTEFDFSQLFQIEMNIIKDEAVWYILNHLTPKMARQCNIQTILRLMTLLSVCKSGLKQSYLDQIRKTFIASYGY